LKLWGGRDMTAGLKGLVGEVEGDKRGKHQRKGKIKKVEIRSLGGRPEEGAAIKVVPGVSRKEGK